MFFASIFPTEKGKIRLQLIVKSIEYIGIQKAQSSMNKPKNIDYDYPL